MGKHAKRTAYKKLQKQEKSKVKFKVSHKTELPKGLNITKTDFKVKKIVLRDQVKLQNENEIVYKCNLSIKELLSRLNHHNMPLRLNALNGISEIINKHGMSNLVPYFPSLLDATSRMILDKEFEIRSNSLKVLSLILSQVTETQLSPLFEIIVKYLTCSMSHIDSNIRESSLEMLDILVVRFSKLIAAHCQATILPAFLDLISTKFSTTEQRQLSFQHTDKMSSAVWRMKVLSRLSTLLKSVVDSHSHTLNNEENLHLTARNIKFTDDQPLYVSLYNTQYLYSEALNFSSLTSVNSDNSVSVKPSEIQTYVEMLLPLLLDIVAEVTPGKKKTEQDCYTLSNEGAVLLKYVSNIILLTWNTISLSDNSQHTKEWFGSKFIDLILDRLITRKFPYRIHEIRNQGSTPDKKKRKNNKTSGSLPNEFANILTNPHCVEENLALCQIYISLTLYMKHSNELKRITSYINECLRSYETLSHTETEILFNCVDMLLSFDVDLQTKGFNIQKLVISVKQLYQKSSASHDTKIVQYTFNHLCKVVMNKNIRSLNKEAELHDFLDGLPQLLIRKRVSYDMLQKISDIARCNIPTFVHSLDGYIEAILDNLPNIEILTDKKLLRTEGKKTIANLLYFVQCWDKEFCSHLKAAIQNQYFGHLTSYISDIFNIKANSQ